MLVGKGEITQGGTSNPATSLLKPVNTGGKSLVLNGKLREMA